MTTTPVSESDDEPTERPIRLFCPLCARSITALGRSTIDEIERLDIECSGTERTLGVQRLEPHAPQMMLIDEA